MSGYVTVQVTQEDIRDGRPLDAGSCPLALALKRVGYPLACVYADDWCPAPMDVRHLHPRLPGSARSFIGRFDHDGYVQPATFRLPLP